VSNGFLPILNLVDRSYTAVRYPNATLPTLSISTKEYPTKISDELERQLPLFVSSTLVWCFIPEIVILMISLVREKQERAKECKALGRR
jgi:hypothetical protein